MVTTTDLSSSPLSSRYSPSSHQTPPSLNHPNCMATGEARSHVGRNDQKDDDDVSNTNRSSPHNNKANTSPATSTRRRTTTRRLVTAIGILRLIFVCLGTGVWFGGIFPDVEHVVVMSQHYHHGLSRALAALLIQPSPAGFAGTTALDHMEETWALRRHLRINNLDNDDGDDDNTTMGGWFRIVYRKSHHKHLGQEDEVLSALPPLLHGVLEPLLLFLLLPLLTWLGFTDPRIVLQWLWGLTLQGVDFCVAYQLECLCRTTIAKLTQQQRPPKGKDDDDDDNANHEFGTNDEALILDSFYWYRRSQLATVAVEEDSLVDPKTKKKDAADDGVYSNSLDSTCNKPSQVNSSNGTNDSSNSTTTMSTTTGIGATVVTNTFSSPEFLAWHGQSVRYRQPLWWWLTKELPSFLFLLYWASPVTILSSSLFGSHQNLRVLCLVTALNKAASLRQEQAVIGSNTTMATTTKTIQIAMWLALATHLDLALAVYMFPILALLYYSSCWSKSFASLTQQGQQQPRPPKRGAWWLSVQVGVLYMLLFAGLLSILAILLVGVEPAAVHRHHNNRNHSDFCCCSCCITWYSIDLPCLARHRRCPFFGIRKCKSFVDFPPIFKFSWPAYPP